MSNGRTKQLLVPVIHTPVTPENIKQAWDQDTSHEGR